jgi:hypothetical protein
MLTIAGQTYSSKTAALQAARRVIQKMLDDGICDVTRKDLATREHHRTLLDIFKEHKDPYGKLGIASWAELGDEVLVHFRLKAEPPPKKGCMISVVNVNTGIANSFSWNKCITGAWGPREYKQDLTNAMRFCVESDCNAYRQEQFRLVAPAQPTCQHCLALHTEDHKLVVDHWPLRFQFIQQDFLVNHTAPLAFDKEETKSRPLFKQQDEAFAQAWKAYHREHAGLRLLCNTCNGSTCNKGEYRKRPAPPLQTEDAQHEDEPAAKRVQL